jgi:hypothetical protein
MKIIYLWNFLKDDDDQMADMAGDDDDGSYNESE